MAGAARCPAVLADRVQERAAWGRVAGLQGTPMRAEATRALATRALAGKRRRRHAQRIRPRTETAAWPRTSPALGAVTRPFRAARLRTATARTIGYSRRRSRPVRSHLGAAQRQPMSRARESRPPAFSLRGATRVRSAHAAGRASRSLALHTRSAPVRGARRSCLTRVPLARCLPEPCAARLPACSRTPALRLPVSTDCGFGSAT